jgi:hypothetical protein
MFYEQPLESSNILVNVLSFVFLSNQEYNKQCIMIIMIIVKITLYLIMVVLLV